MPEPHFLHRAEEQDFRRRVKSKGRWRLGCRGCALGLGGGVGRGMEDGALLGTSVVAGGTEL